MQSDTKLSITKCAEHFNCSEGEIKAAIVNLGLRPRVTAGTEMEQNELPKLQQHFDSQRKSAAAPGRDAGGGSRVTGNVAVTERKTRARGPRRSLGILGALPGRQSAAPDPAAPPPAAADAAKKTITMPKTTAAAPSPSEAPATADAPATPAQSTQQATALQEATVVTEETKAAQEPKKAKATKTTKPAKKAPAQPQEESASAATKTATATEQESKPAQQPAEQSAESSDESAAAQPDPNAPINPLQALIDKQVAHKNEQLQKAEQIRQAAEQQRQQRQQQQQAPKQKKGAAKGAVKGDTKGTISLGREAVESHLRKKKPGLTRTQARQQTTERQHTFQKPTAPVVREVRIPDAIQVEKLAGELALKSSVVIRKLMENGMSVTANELLDKETAWILVEELGHIPIEAPQDDIEENLKKRHLEGKVLNPRAPVVTIMGHVDHGKTSLLDYIRKTRVAAGEAGGITQHISAYYVEQEKTGAVTFIDTPGHELFTQMRARGAKITDIVVLVVAADEGVRPQTIEAINHTKAANVPIVVAATKIDKPDTDMERVKRELADNDVLCEEWGGDVAIFPLSSHTGKGIDELLDRLALQTEMLELTAPADVPAAGVVVEARIDKGRGTVATIIVTHGALKVGDIFLCGTESGRVRAMWNLSNPKLALATPSMPVEIQGFSGIPDAGAELYVVEDERTAREITAIRQDKSRLQKFVSRRGLSLSGQQSPSAALFADADAENEMKELNVVVKADVEGARESLVAALAKIAGKKARVKIIHSAVGAVTESDIYLAQTGGGVVAAFNVRPDSRARKLAESRGVKIIAGNVVYDLVENVQEAVLGLLSPIVQETVIGSAAVLKVFGISKAGNIAGCRVEEGVVTSKAPARLVRDGAIVHTGVVSSLYHYKDQVSEVKSGSECGIGIARFNDIKAGDVIEILERTEIAAEM